MAEEAPEKAAEGDEHAAPKKKIPLALIALVLQLLIMIGAAVVITKGTLLAPRPDMRPATMKERALASIRDDSKKIEFMPLNEFMVNLTGKHVIRATMQLEVSNAQVTELLNKRMPAVKSRILRVLSLQSVDMTDTIQGKLLLKDAIREALNEELSLNGEHNGVVRDVYFTEFMMI